MRFQVTERINTNALITEVGASLQENFQRIASTAQPVGSVLRVTSIQASFGSINRTDVTDIKIQRAENGYLLTADVNYQPSAAFWIILVVTLFTWVGWVVPIAFYLLQKETVKRGIEEGFRNVKNQLSSPVVPISSVPRDSRDSAVADLEKLAGLLSQGLITKEEFSQQKRRIFGEPSGSPENQVRTPSPPPVPSSSRQTLTVNQGDPNEDQAAKAFAEARNYVKSGQKDLATTILKDIIKRFPQTNAAAQSRKSLAPRPKP
jgi:hypothetical protein